MVLVTEERVGGRPDEGKIHRWNPRFGSQDVNSLTKYLSYVKRDPPNQGMGDKEPPNFNWP
jgi:hypothetical protein